MLGFGICDFCLVEVWGRGLERGFFKGVVELIMIEGGWVFFGVIFLCFLFLVNEVKRELMKINYIKSSMCLCY